MMKMTTRPTDTNLRLLPIALVLAISGVMPSGPASAASLTVSSATVQEAGDSARVCVGLSAGGENVAATQNELVWDANCASLVDKCEANSAHGKQLMSNQKSASQLRAIIISLQDTNTIPDGELYCCTFRINLANGGACCAIGLQGMSASDPEGQALGLAGRGGQVCLARDAGSGGGLEGAGRQDPGVVGADLGTAPQPAAPQAGQPAGQQAAPQGAGSGSTVAQGGAGGVQGGVGGVPGGVGGIPGGQPGSAPVQPGQAPQAAAPAPGAEAPVQAPAAGQPQRPLAGAEGTPTAAPGAPAQQAPAAPAAPAAPKATAVPAKPAAPGAPKATVKAAAPAAPEAASGGGCSCEITSGAVGFEATSGLLVVGLLLWARRKRY